jgi:hypothetical protein
LAFIISMFIRRFEQKLKMLKRKKIILFFMMEELLEK